MKENQFRRGWCICVILCMLLSGCRDAANYRQEMVISKEVSQSKEKEENVSNLAFQVVEDMRIGWNLGNTLDSCDYKKKGINSKVKKNTPELYYEQLWNNPVTSKKMITRVAEAGFGAVRVPVSYYDHMDKNFMIRKEWLDRVEKVVKYVLENDMYCIINLHHEVAWLTADKSKLKKNQKRLEIVWSQIAKRFKGYGKYLIFEGFNEIQDKEKRWSEADISSYEAVNQLNQTFVNTIRKSSGFNGERYLIVNTYAAATDKMTLEEFQLPKDIIENHLIAQVHTYAPLEFAWTKKEVSWTKVRDTWEDEKDATIINEIMGRLNNELVSRGIPVIIGEFGAWNKNNTKERVKYVKHVVSTAKTYGITCFWWDCGGIYKSKKEINNSVLFNRSELVWYYPEIVDALIEAASYKK